MNGLEQLVLGLLIIIVLDGLILAIARRWISRPQKRDWGFEMQCAAEKHLEACGDALWLEEEAGAVEVPSPAAAPFCGCTTCTVREVLVAAWPTIQDMILDVSHNSHVEFSLIAKPHGE